MKTFSVCSLVTLSLVTLTLNAKASSAPDAHVAISAAPATSHQVVNGSHSTTTSPSHASPKAAKAVTPTSSNKAALTHAFHETVAVAHSKLYTSAVPINTWLGGFNTRYINATTSPMAVTPAERRQNAALTTTYNRVNADVRHINNSISKLSMARSSEEAIADCTKIKTYAKDVVDFLHRDLVDVEALKLIAAGDKKAGNALVLRGDKIEHGKNVITPFRNLAMIAHEQAQALASIMEPSVNAGRGQSAIEGADTKKANSQSLVQPNI